MLQDSSIRKSLEQYVRRRISEIPSEINQTFPKIRQVWKCENEIDFLYGYYVGKIEEGALHYLLKATRTSKSGFLEVFEIREIVETYRKEIREEIKYSLNQ